MLVWKGGDYLWVDILTSAVMLGILKPHQTVGAKNRNNY